MSIGNPPTTGGVNQSLQNFAVGLRDLCESIRDYNTWLTNQGLGALETAGFSPADAQTVLNLLGYLNTFPGIYYGTATQSTDFDFDNALSALWGGQ